MTITALAMVHVYIHHPAHVRVVPRHLDRIHDLGAG
jgi:hypothetical protein